MIEAKLQVLDDWLTEHGGRQRHYVDTGPVPERDFAALAGAGWHGKSTMLVHPKLGTWFFLAELLTTLEFEADAPMHDHCGKCTRCMVACPTGAITAPRQLDARRCVSYLTIENKGVNPEDYVHRIGRTGRALQVGDAVTIFTAEEIDHVRSIERFIGTAIKRVKLEGFNYIYTALFNESQIPAGGVGKGVRTARGYSFGARRKR